MVAKSKKGMTDIEILNRALYGSIVCIKDIAIQVRLTLTIMDALNRLEDETVHRA